MSDTEGVANPQQGVSRAMLPDFREVFEVSPRPLLLIAADDRLTMVAVNKAHAAAFGTTQEALTGRGILEVFPPDPSPDIAAFIEAIRTSLRRVIETRQPDQMGTRRTPLRGSDGRPVERYVTATNAPILGPDGVVTHVVIAVLDVTGEVLERRSEEARTLLMREVDHRARNALTVVQSFVRLTRAESMDEFRRIMDGRVAALARAQTSLAARRWEGAGLGDVIEAELSAMSATGRFSVTGPRVVLGPERVQAMSMAIHELATNAGKYGALSTGGGTLSVNWTRDAGGRLNLVWLEDGGPAVIAPSRQGFGSRLIGRLARQLGGDIVYEWRPSGLRAEMNLDLGRGPMGAPPAESDAPA
ncbi:HWE histidine kinase domain-containing protein [uncultured Phenylobacterium sp.]|uniref:HWE histidine kinase domain-containing protein n=1 Tax=uncultured Phenylobacterium sp. TaxID=349273 RepID=UPI0025EF7C0F|nr:HWE histidine kinase domain-containing protein [uncultured Phenylobacterium sp.]